MLMICGVDVLDMNRLLRGVWEVMLVSHPIVSEAGHMAMNEGNVGTEAAAYGVCCSYQGW